MRDQQQRKFHRSPEAILGLVAGACLLALFIIALPRLDHRNGGENPHEHGDHALAEPIAGFDPPSFDFGTILQQETIHHTFKLVNRGTADLRLVGMQADCSCTFLSTNMLGMVIRPNTQLEMPVTLGSESRSGSVVSRITVVLRDNTTNYIVQGTLEGIIAPDFVFEPRNVNFGTLYPGDTARRSVLFQPVAVSEFALMKTQVSHGPFFISVEDKGVSFTLNAANVARRESYSYQFRVHTTSERVPEVVIPISGHVVPEVELRPDVLVLPLDTTLPESRFTVQTRDSSRIKSVARKTADGTAHIEAFELDSAAGQWALSHSFRIHNSALEGAVRIDVELELRQEAGRRETRLAFAEIRSLHQ
jgi:hypothetical protein